MVILQEANCWVLSYQETIFWGFYSQGSIIPGGNSLGRNLPGDNLVEKYVKGSISRGQFFGRQSSRSQFVGQLNHWEIFERYFFFRGGGEAIFQEVHFSLNPFAADRIRCKHQVVFIFWSFNRSELKHV